MSRTLALRALTALPLIGALLLLASLADPPQAGAARFYACLTGGGRAHLYTRKPHCRKGARRVFWNTKGTNGEAGADGLDGSDGLDGEDGIDGGDGADGSDGTDGAVAGYVALQDAGQVDLAKQANLIEIPGLSSELSAGSYIVSGEVQIAAASSATGGDAGVSCELTDTPEDSSETSQTGRWLSTLSVPVSASYGADGEIDLNLAVTSTGGESTISMQCQEIAESGSDVSIDLSDGTLVAVQTSDNK